MQELIYIRRTHGVSKKGNDYDMVELSNGLATFTVSSSPELASQWKDSGLKDGDSFSARMEIGVRFGALSATIVEFEV
jgi:hypothetical protein